MAAGRARGRQGARRAPPRASRDESYGNQLLVALAAMFDEDHAVLASKDICNALNANEELPFGAMRRGDGIDPRGLARLCARTTSARRTCGSPTAPGRATAREDFDDAWARYAPQSIPAEDRENREERENPPAEPNRPRGPRGLAD